MKLTYKDDWEAARERYLNWWHGEYIGRAGMWVTAPKDSQPGTPPPQEPADPVRRWTDLDYIAALNDYQHRSTHFGGEALPVWTTGYPGHISIPAFLGCPCQLDHNTGWWDPILLDRDWRPEDLRLNEETGWYAFGLKALERGTRESIGKSIPSIGAFGGSGDTLSALRGTERLLLDLVDRPGRVRETEKRLMDIWIAVFESFHSIVAPASHGGTTCYFNLWAPGKFYGVHNDFSYMISTAMFEDLFLPEIRRQTEFLDYTVYHVDGIGAFKHVPLLCQIDTIQAFQILPGSGQPSPLHYREILETVQKAGKNLHITIAPDEVEAALDMLSASGLFIKVKRASSETEAKKLIETTQKKSRIR